MRDGTPPVGPPRDPHERYSSENQANNVHEGTENLNFHQTSDTTNGPRQGTNYNPPEDHSGVQHQPSSNPSTSSSPMRLKVRTSGPDMNNYPSVSMLPTPLVGSSEESWNSAKGRSSPRNVSASFAQDSIHSNLLMEQPSPISPMIVSRTPTVDLGRSDTLKVPKRRAGGAQLGRSLSVGGPQRLPSTILHREPKVETVGETLPADVYVATTLSGGHTAWTRVTTAGKGSFSEVILARPAIEFVKPELVDDIEDRAEEEIAEYESDKENGTMIGSGGIVGNTSALSGSHRRSTNVLVAVKITALNHARADSELQLFKRDLDIMSKLPHHPSLMRLIAWSLDEQVHKRALFVLPYCCGGDLFDLVAKHRSKMQPILIRRLFADVCSAVVFLHRHLIVHRDIKLENVLLDVPVAQILSMAEPNKYPGPLAILTDLGLARKIDGDNPMLSTRCGSDDYVPPEIMMGQPYDGRETDSWALGVLLYAMMEGRLPFDAPPHMQQYEGSRARLRTAHRIARVDWGWYKRKDLGPDDQEWQGGKEVVEGCLKRRQQRRLAADTLQMPFVRDAIEPIIHESHDADDEIWKIFVQ